MTKSIFETSLLFSSASIQQRFRTFSRSLVGETTELGRAREEMLRDYLRNVLPQRFEVGQGQVVDIDGQSSGEVDIVIADRHVGARLQYMGSRRIFPCETVCGAVEVVGDLTPSALDKSVTKVHSVKTLNRAREGKNSSALGGGWVQGDKWDEEKFPYQIGCAIIAFSCGRPLTNLTEELGGKVKQQPRRTWPNLLCVLESGVIAYGSAAEQISINPMDAQGLLPIAKDQYDPLAALTVLLTDLVQTVRVAMPHWSRYGRLHSVTASLWEIENE